MADMAASSHTSHENKVAICGKANVGKTSIFYRIRDDTFVEHMKSQGIQSCDLSVNSNDGRSVEICLWDTLGMERHGAPLTRSHYTDCKIVLLVYDCDNMASLELLESIYDDAVAHAPGATMVLVRNKIDQDFQSVDIDEAVKKICMGDQGQRHRRLACHMATSAKTGDGINELCVELGNLLYNTNPVARNRGISVDEGHPQLRQNSCC